MPQPLALDSANCRYDLVSLGECMLRLSPKAHDRLEFARELEVFVGGAEYNVSYALSRLGCRTAWIGGLVENPLGHQIRAHAQGAGIDLDHAVWRPHDGVGRDARIGLNFTEVGTGIRPSVTLYDRGHSATASLEPEDVDWAQLFERDRVRWFHTGGVFTALSDSTIRVAQTALRAAKASGTFVSYDLNFRSKLWSSQKAIEATRPLMPYIDALIGNEEDFQKVLGYEVQGADNLRDLEVDSYQAMVRQVAEDHPHLTLIATTLRDVVSGTVNHWSAILYWLADKTFYQGPKFDNLQITDRVGGGDGFASGLAYALLNGETPQAAVHLGTAHGALLQSTRGDTSQITLRELEHVATGGSARIQR